MKDRKTWQMSRLALVIVIGGMFLPILHGGEPALVRPPRRIERIRRPVPSRDLRVERLRTERNLRLDREKRRLGTRPLHRGEWGQRPPSSSLGRSTFQRAPIHGAREPEHRFYREEKKPIPMKKEEKPKGLPNSEPTQRTPTESPPLPSRSSPLPAGMEPFRSFVENNIFDSERRPHLPGSRDKGEERTPGPDYLAICGVLLYGTNCLIFTESGHPEWQGSYHPGDQIGRFRLLSANTHCVILQLANGQRLTVPVGEAVVQRETNRWVVAPPPMEALQSSQGPSSEDGSGSSSSSLSGDSHPAVKSSSETFPKGIPEEILRRLRERRLKELSQ